MKAAAAICVDERGETTFRGFHVHVLTQTLLNAADDQRCASFSTVLLQRLKISLSASSR